MSTKWVCHYFVCPFFGIQFTSQFSRYWDIISFWIDYWNVCFYLPPTFVMCIYLAFFYYITPFPVFHLFVMISLSTLWDFHLHVASKREVSSEKVHECPKNVLECPTHVQGLTWYHVSCENLLRHQRQNGSCFPTVLAVARHDDACKVHMKKCVVLCRVNVVQCRPDVVLMS